MRFASPLFFLLFFALIPFLFRKKTSGGRIRYSNVTALQSLAYQGWFSPLQLLWLLRIVGMALFVFALARPQSGKKISEVLSEGIDIFMVIDTSGSMKGLDFKLGGRPTSRIDVVKQVATDFVKRRPGDRLGIVVFGDEAFTQCPLTLDHGVVVDFLSQIRSGMAGESTAIGDGLGTAVNRMKNLKAKSKVVILLTDGVNQTGRITPIKAAEIAQSFGIRVYTIGAGSKGPIPFLQDTPFGPQYIYQEGDLDEDTLREIAKITGGRYYRATQTSELDQIYKEIDQLEKSETKVKEYTEYEELFPLFLIPGILMLLGEAILSQTRLRKIP